MNRSSGLLPDDKERWRRALISPNNQTSRNSFQFVCAFYRISLRVPSLKSNWRVWFTDFVFCRLQLVRKGKNSTDNLAISEGRSLRALAVGNFAVSLVHSHHWLCRRVPDSDGPFSIRRILLRLCQFSVHILLWLGLLNRIKRLSFVLRRGNSSERPREL